jgi:acyl-CoA thioester hydrolase
MSYSKTFQVIWANLDPNMHLRHTAYNDYAAQVRLSYFLDKGFSVHELAKLQIGPILFREDTHFLKEVGMNETITIDCLLTGLRKDGSRWNIIHTIYKSDGVKSAVIAVEGAWLDLKVRKLTSPPEVLRDAIETMPRAENFAWLPDKSEKKV